MPDAFHQLIQRVYRTRRTRARIIIDQSLEVLPHYRGVPDSRLVDVRKSVLHHLALFYHRTLETGRALTPDDLEPSRQIARKRASQGVPLGEFLTFFQVGLSVIWEHLIASVGDSPSLRDRLLDRVDAVISNQTQLMTALVEAYVDERERLSRFREQDLDDFFQVLLAEDATENVLELRARSLGLLLETSHTIAIFGPNASAGSGGTAVTPDQIRRTLARHLRNGSFELGRTREGFMALLPEDPDPRALATAVGRLAEDLHVGVGGSGRGVEGLRRSAQEALRALRIGINLRRAERVHRYAEVEILDLVQIDSANTAEFMQRVLGPLLKAGTSRTYLETLRQLLAHGHRIKPAAAALSIHPHTLSYRLKQIRRRFGIELDDPDERLRVQLALAIFDAQTAVPDGRRPRARTPAIRRS